MSRTKATVRRLPVKTCQLPAWVMNREYVYTKRNGLSLQYKGNFTRTVDCEHYQERTNYKNDKCTKKIQVFYRLEQANLLTVKIFFF